MNETQAIRQAQDIVKSLPLSDLDEDGTWENVGNDWDVNVYRDPDDNNIKATLYPVHNGNTDTSRGIRVPLPTFASYTCADCGTSFDTIDDLQDHADDNHN